MANVADIHTMRWNARNERTTRAVIVQRIYDFSTVLYRLSLIPLSYLTVICIARKQYYSFVNFVSRIEILQTIEFRFLYEKKGSVSGRTTMAKIP